MRGLLFLRVGLCGSQSRLLESHCEFPLQVLRPQTAGRGLELVLLTPCGGLLDGDELEAQVVVGAGASLHLRTQAATQVHSGSSSQTWTVSLEAGASLSSVPRAVVPHAGASYQSKTSIEMASDARLLVAETFAPGRALRGELFAYEQISSDLDVWQEGRLVARERQVLRPSELLEQQIGPYPYFGSAYALGRDACLDAAETDGVLLGSSPLASGGTCVRLLGQRSFDLELALARLLDSWRQGAAVSHSKDGVSAPQLLAG